MKGAPWGHTEGQTELQRRILESARLYPDEGPASLAERCDCSTSYVRKTLREYAADDDRAFAIEVDGPIGLRDVEDGVVVADPDHVAAPDDGHDEILFDESESDEAETEDSARDVPDIENG